MEPPQISTVGARMSDGQDREEGGYRRSDIGGLLDHIKGLACDLRDRRSALKFRQEKSRINEQGRE